MASNGPVESSIVTIVQTDAVLAPKLPGARKIYNGVAPEQSPTPFLTIPTASVARYPLFGVRAHAPIIQLDIWSAVGRPQVYDLYGDLERLFDQQRIVVAGHVVYDSTLELLAAILDVESQLWHGITNLRLTTRQSA